MSLYFVEFLSMAGFIQINLIALFSLNSEALIQHLSLNHHFELFSLCFIKYFIQTQLLSYFIRLI